MCCLQLTVAPDTTFSNTTTTTIATSTTTSTTTVSSLYTTASIIPTTGRAIHSYTSTSPSSSTHITSSNSDSSSNGAVAAIVLSLVVFIIIIIIVVVAIIVVWKKKRSRSTKPEGVYYSNIGEGTLQISLPEPFYSKLSGEQNNHAKSICNNSPTQQHVTCSMQDNPSYSDPKEQVMLQDNSAYGSTSKYKELKE